MGAPEGTAMPWGAVAGSSRTLQLRSPCHPDPLRVRTASWARFRVGAQGPARGESVREASLACNPHH